MVMPYFIGLILSIVGFLQLQVKVKQVYNTSVIIDMYEKNDD